MSLADGLAYLTQKAQEKQQIMVANKNRQKQLEAQKREETRQAVNQQKILNRTPL